MIYQIGLSEQVNQILTQVQTVEVIIINGLGMVSAFCTCSINTLPIKLQYIHIVLVRLHQSIVRQTTKSTKVVL